MQAKAEAPNTRLTVAAVAQVSLGTWISTVTAVMSTMLLIACQAFTVIIASYLQKV